MKAKIGLRLELTWFVIVDLGVVFGGSARMKSGNGPFDPLDDEVEP